MTRRGSGRLAWSLFAGFVLTSALGVLLLAQVPGAALDREGDSLALSLSFVVVLFVFGLVGAVVAARLPANPFGWLFLALAMIEGCYELSYGWTHYSLAVEPLPATVWTGWFANWSSPLSPALIGLAFLLFPDGRLLSPRWRPAAWLCGLAILPVVGRYALTPGPITEFPSLDNPVGWSAAEPLDEMWTDAWFVLIFVVTTASVVVRLRRARGVERQQLKWFAWSAGLMLTYLVVGGLASGIAGVDAEADYLMGFVFAVVLCGLPVSAGLAILRYRLYDIDLVINRTLVYGALTAGLVATYLVSVLVSRLLLAPLTGETDLAVAASTLVAAAMFRPLRSRIQAEVDRRFYRSRYDAARTLESFSGRLRDELDLDALGVDLRHVVRRTLQPAHVSLWMRGSP
jgi:hypothetical protein